MDSILSVSIEILHIEINQEAPHMRRYGSGWLLFGPLPDVLGTEHKSFGAPQASFDFVPLNTLRQFG